MLRRCDLYADICVDMSRQIFDFIKQLRNLTLKVIVKGRMRMMVNFVDFKSLI